MASETLAGPLSRFPGYTSKTFVFKKIGDDELKIDVLYPAQTISSKPRNLLLHIHGGFLVSPPIPTPPQQA